MKIGYVRVSKQEQHEMLQIDALKEVGCEKWFLDKMTGSKAERQGLDYAPTSAKSRTRTRRRQMIKDWTNQLKHFILSVEQRRKQTMATIEERLQAIEQEHKILEQEHTELKKTIELQTIAIGALVNKATLEKLNEKYDKIFDTLIAHDRLTNEQLAELRRQQIEEDGKIVGLQTEIRQRFNEQDSKFNTRLNQVDTRLNGIDTHFNQVETLLTQILARLPEKP